MADTKISALTAVTTPAGASEFAVNEAGTSKKMTLNQIAEFAQATHIARIANDFTLTSATTPQKLFNVGANGAVTLTLGVYLFDAMINLKSMSATSGNGTFSLIGAGTATLDDILYETLAIDGAVATVAARQGSTQITANTPANVATAGTGTVLNLQTWGSFEVTANGTLIPSFSLFTAAAAIVTKGSYIRFSRVGGTNMTSVGSWS